jgi:hypothetical protein
MVWIPATLTAWSSRPLGSFAVRSSWLRLTLDMVVDDRQRPLYGSRINGRKIRREYVKIRGLLMSTM